MHYKYTVKTDAKPAKLR